MKSTNKRLVSILLCLAMVLAMLPMAVFAADTTRLYCAAPSSWTNCNVYYWGNAAGAPTWPGLAMTQGSNGIWYYDVPADATNVIFNNGSAQSSDLTMPTDDNVQFNYTAGTWGTYGSTVETPEVEMVTVYVEAPASWGTPNAYFWGSSVDAPGWPGYAMTLHEGYVYTYDVPADITGLIFNGAGGQTSDLTLPENDTDIMYDVANSCWTALAVEEPDPMVIDSVVAVGAGSGNFLYGVEWDPASSFNVMEGVDNVYTITYMGVAAGTYQYKFAANGTWDISFGAGCETVSGEIYDAWFNGTDNTLNVAVDGSTVTLTLDLSGMDFVTGEGAVCSVVIEEPAVSTAPEALVLGGNDFSIAAGDTNAIGSTYIVEQAGFLNVNVSAMTTPDGEVPAAYIPMQFGRMYALLVNGEQVWLPCEIEVAVGDEVEVAVQSYMGAETDITVDLSIREPGTNDIKWQLNADASADDAAVDLRLISWVDSLDYENVTFVVTIDGQTAELACQTVYTGINADGEVITDLTMFNDTAAYFVTFTIENLAAEYYDSEIAVTMNWTDLEGNVTESETRTIVVSDAF